MGKAVLGDRVGFWVVATTQFVLLVGLMVTYMVTAGQSLQAATNPQCNDHTMQVQFLTWESKRAAVLFALSLCVCKAIRCFLYV